MFDSFSAAYDEMREILSEYASHSFQSYGYIQYTFEIDRLEKLKTTQETLEVAYATWANTIHLIPLPDWKETLQSRLEYWICVSPEMSFYSSEDVKNVMNKIEQLVQPLAVWQVEIQAKGFYELNWEDFALENDHSVFFLHLGFSD